MKTLTLRVGAGSAPDVFTPGQLLVALTEALGGRVNWVPRASLAAASGFRTTGPGDVPAPPDLTQLISTVNASTLPSSSASGDAPPPPDLMSLIQGEKRT